MQFLCIMSEDSAGDEVNDPNYIVVNKIFFVYAHLFLTVAGRGERLKPSHAYS